MKSKITVIGAANMDLIGYPKYKLIYKDANIGKIEPKLGGVGRNIAENLSKLGFEVEFLSVFAQDDFSKKIINSCYKLGIHSDNSLVLKNKTSSVFMAIMDINNDMAIALNDMDIYNHVPDSFILNNLDLIRQNDCCVLETNMPQRILELVTEKLPDICYALDTVSGKKALKAKTILNKLTILKCNLLEAELLCDLQAANHNDPKKLVASLTKLGVKKVFITLGSDGIVYGDTQGVYQLQIKPLKPINTVGAGDAFMSGLVYSEINNFDIHKMVVFANACAKITVQHKDTVHPALNANLILKTLNEQ